jgi:hypothetical protein
MSLRTPVAPSKSVVRWLSISSVSLSRLPGNLGGRIRWLKIHSNEEADKGDIAVVCPERADKEYVPLEEKRWWRLDWAKTWRTEISGMRPSESS